MQRKTGLRLCAVCAGILLATGLTSARSGPYGDPAISFGRSGAWDNGNNRFQPYSFPGARTSGAGPARNIWSGAQPMTNQRQGTQAPMSRSNQLYPPAHNKRYPYPSQASPAVGQRAYSWQSSRPTSRQPWIEVELNASEPYVNQGLLYTVRVVSTTNLLTIKPMITGADGFIVEKLIGPLTSSRSDRGRNEIINEYRYLLTPIRAGELELPPARISGTMVGSQQWQYGRYAGNQSGGRAFDIESSAPVTLNVRPALVSKVSPWLALKDLTIEGGLDPHEELAIGEPITYRVKLKARGAGGERLPSVEGQLQNSGFQVYREDIQTRRVISRDGKRLTGYRTETYTLVPSGAASIRVPTVRIPWWNVDADLREEAILRSSAAWASGGQPAARPVTGGAVFSFWTPVLLAITATLSYWLGMWARGTRFGQWVSERVTGMFRRVGRRITALLRYASPRRMLFAARRRLALFMPRSLRLWYCLRCIRKERDPEEWCHLFKFLACKELNTGPQTTLTDLADKIAEAHPGARPATLHRLVSQLDGAMYGGMDFDFDEWKKKWARQLRPVWMPRLLGSGPSRRARLPSLNPTKV